MYIINCALFLEVLQSFGEFTLIFNPNEMFYKWEILFVSKNIILCMMAMPMAI